MSIPSLPSPEAGPLTTSELAALRTLLAEKAALEAEKADLAAKTLATERAIIEAEIDAMSESTDLLGSVNAALGAIAEGLQLFEEALQAKHGGAEWQYLVRSLGNLSDALSSYRNHREKMDMLPHSNRMADFKAKVSECIEYSEGLLKRVSALSAEQLRSNGRFRSHQAVQQ